MKSFEVIKKELIPFRDTNIETIIGKIRNKTERFVSRAEIERATGISDNTLRNIEHRNRELFNKLSYNITASTISGSGQVIKLYNLAQVNAFLNRVSINRIKNKEKRENILNFQVWANQTLASVETGEYQKEVANQVMDKISLVIAKNLNDQQLSVNKQLAILIGNQEKQQQEIQETKQLAQEAIARTEHITKREFWDLYHMIKRLKDMGDKYIWRDVERVFRISNLGQLPASEYQTCIEFLKDRERALFKNQPKINEYSRSLP